MNTIFQLDNIKNEFTNQIFKKEHMEDLKKLRCKMLNEIILMYKNKNLNDIEFLDKLSKNETKNIFKKFKSILEDLPPHNIETEDILTILNIIENFNNKKIKNNIEEVANDISLKIRLFYLLLEKFIYLYEKEKRLI